MSDAGWTFLSTTLGPSRPTDNVLDMLYQFHAIVAGLHGADPGKGRLVWIPDEAPPTPTVKRWRVNVSSASLRAGPATTANRLSLAQQGDVLTQIGEQPPDWLQTEKGWILAKQVEAV